MNSHPFASFSSARSSAPRARVLLADQDADSRSALASALIADGYDVSLAADGEAALDAVAVAHDRGLFPHALVLDFRMPRLSGLGVVHALRHLSFLPPVILLSGLLDPSVELVARRVGVDRVLFKPISAAAILEELDGALSPREHARRPRGRVRPADGP